MDPAKQKRFGRPWQIALGAFLLAFVLSLLLHHASALHDTDSYFHLAIARLYTQQGVVHDLPALRMSLMRDGYGDKELLFHLLLAPLVAYLPPLWAGRLALSLFAGLVAALLAFLAQRVIGRWALLFPLWLFFASTELTWRLVRLRPELLSLCLLLLAAWAMASRRDVLLALLAAAYTLGYTAFQAFLGLVFLTFIAYGLLEAGREWRRWPWRMLLYSWLGAGLGLILHPHFPKNLLVWWVQNVTFFADKAGLDVGTEIRPNTTDVLLMVHLGLFCMLLVLALAARRRVKEEAEEPAGEAEEPGVDLRLLVALAIFAGAFGFLYLLMSRFSLYFWPFATLTFFYFLRRRGLEIGGSLQVFGRRCPLVWGLLLALLVSTPEAWRQFLTYRQRTSLGPNEARLRDREELAAALPLGAKVAADWGPTATYLLWAPQALYLNSLDPVFMATLYPREHAALRSILDGQAADVPELTVGLLDSDYLAFPAVGHEELIERLKSDPRVRLLHRGSHVLVAFRPAPELRVDWRVAPGSLAPPVAADADIASWPSYPLAGEEGARAIEGYVDGDRLGPEIPCLTLARDLVAESARRVEVEWTVNGRATLWLDGERQLEASGRVLLPLELAAGRHRVSLQLCGTDGAVGKGFYWREL